MAKTWQCGDCGTKYPKSVHHCTRYFDDYLSLRGGTIEAAIHRAVRVAIAPLVKRAEDRLAAPSTQVRWVRNNPAFNTTRQVYDSLTMAA